MDDARTKIVSQLLKCGSHWRGAGVVATPRSSKDLSRLMDAAILDALLDVLNIVCEAQQAVEGHVALMRFVNADIESSLRILKDREGRFVDKHACHAELPSRPAKATAAGQANASPGPPLQQRATSTTLSSRGTTYAQRRQPQTTSTSTNPKAEKQQHHQRYQQPQKQDIESSSWSCLQLPSAFVHLQQQYATLRSQRDFDTHQYAASVTKAAAAPFLSSLEHAFGPALHAVQQPTASSQAQQANASTLSPQAFAEQAYFLGLVAAVLTALKEVDGISSSTGVPFDPAVHPLVQVLPELIHYCEHWQQQHMHSPMMAAGPAPEQQKQQQAQLQRGDVARWRNRLLRVLLRQAGPAAGNRQVVRSTSSHSGHTTAAAAAVATPMASSDAPQAAKKAGHADVHHEVHMPGLWLPDSCWQHLVQQPGSGDPHTTDGTAAVRHACWQVLLPLLPGQQQSDTRRTPAGPTRISESSASSGGRSRLPAVHHTQLSYGELPELLSFSKQLLKLQQLLLHLEVESKAAERLLQLLQECCQRQQQQQPHSAAEVTMERCCALYRVVYALTAGPVKQRGLGAGCQLAVEVVGSSTLPM